MQRKFSKKQKIPLLKFLIGAILLFLIGSIIFIIFFSNFLKVGAVEVKKGNIACANENELKDTSQILGQNLLLIDGRFIEKKLKEKYLCVKSIKILREFPNQVLLEVFAREPVAQILVLKNYEASQSGILDSFQATSSASFYPDGNVAASFVVDSEGVIFPKDSQNLNYPKVYIEEERVAVKNLLEILKKLKIFGIEVGETKTVGQKILLVNSTPKMIFALDKNIDIQLASLQLILKKAKIDEDYIEFIDLRFDKPILRIAPKK